MDIIDHKSLRTDFVKHAGASPDRPAVEFSAAESLSYGQIDDLARRWAGSVLEALPARPHRVGVFGARSRVAYAGTLAALYAGAAFVPLNPRFPASRTRAMIRSADLDAIFVDPSTAPALCEIMDGLDVKPLIVAPDAATDPDHLAGFDHLSAECLANVEPLRELPPVLGDDLAYLMFTSGTTGEPKGVGVTHANVLHFIDVMSERFRFGPDDRFSQTFDPTFDLAIFDCFMAYRAGATICAMTRKDLLAPSRYVVARNISVWFSVPSVPAMMRKMNRLRPDSMPHLRWSLFCGEPLPQRTAEAWQEAAPNSILENLYGPTELTIACLTYRWDPKRSPGECVNDLVPIGHPFPGLASMVEVGPDSDFADDDADVSGGKSGTTTRGELLVCGPQTVPGYWRNPDATHEKFVERTVAGGMQKIFYKTGDRVERTSAGLYAHLGRADNQVKINGYRVELAEIEAVLMRNDRVATTAVIAWPVDDGSASGVVAFVVGDEVSPEVLLTECRATLPSYMVPSEIREMEALPLNANGKIDRGELLRRLESEAG